MTSPSFREMFQRVVSAQNQGRAAKTVEVFGWICLAEGVVMMAAPGFVASVLHLPALGVPGESYFRLVALLVGGLGMLYIVSGRLNSEEFVFASLIDRPLVPPAMAVLWYLDILPGSLALAFSVQDFAGFLWTLREWRARQAPVALVH